MRTPMLVLLVTIALLAAGCGTEDAEDEAREATTALTDTEGAVETAEEALEDVESQVESAIEDALTLELQEQNDSGITGTVKLSPTSERGVEVEIELEGSDGGPHPAHIHPGTCEDLDPQPQWPLEDVVDGRSKTTVDVSLDDLGLEEYAVNVHESPENMDRYVACADLRSNL